jgi:hypothetical protein
VGSSLGGSGLDIKGKSARVEREVGSSLRGSGLEFKGRVGSSLRGDGIEPNGQKFNFAKTIFRGP